MYEVYSIVQHLKKIIDEIMLKRASKNVEKRDRNIWKIFKSVGYSDKSVEKMTKTQKN